MNNVAQPTNHVNTATVVEIDFDACAALSDPNCPCCKGTGVDAIMDGYDADISGASVSWFSGEYRMCVLCVDPDGIPF